MKSRLRIYLYLLISIGLAGCGDPFSRPVITKEEFIAHFLGARVQPDDLTFVMSNDHGGYSIVAAIRVPHEAGTAFLRKLPPAPPYDPKAESAADDRWWNEDRLKSASEGTGAPDWFKFPYSRLMQKTVFRTDDDGEWAFYWDDIDNNLYLFAVGQKMKTGLNGPIEKIERVTGRSLPFTLERVPSK